VYILLKSFRYLLAIKLSHNGCMIFFYSDQSHREKTDKQGD